jgi:xanthine dehydrogenase accessory factor
MAADVGFRVFVVDDRQQFASTERFPGATDVTVADIEAYLRSAEIPPSAFVVVVTRGHRHDLDALRALSGQRLRYLGMIGSRAKVKQIADALAADGAPADWLRTIHAPIGLRIGAVTPEEIAVSIVAELIAVRRGAAENEALVGQPMRWDRLGS